MSKKRVNTTASARLQQDYMRIKKDPVPYVIGAEPLPSNILEWWVFTFTFDALFRVYLHERLSIKFDVSSFEETTWFIVDQNFYLYILVWC